MKAILLVDDEYALVENLTALLEHEGYRVVSATNGKDALERLKSESPDLLITDHMMPIADGRELVRSLRALADFRALPVIMMSASMKEVALSDEGGKIEVSAFVRKPFQWTRLLEIVTRLIGRAAQEGHA